jgi:NAD+ synthetase
MFKNDEFKHCKESGVTDENIQARIRGIYLMSLANYFNGIVLSTGNKSEMAVGYCTMYGDMVGGLAVIGDLPKTSVYKICEYINRVFKEEILPNNTINKPPSAELRNNQKDQDSLPPYSLLDEVLYRFVDLQQSPEHILDVYNDINKEANYYNKCYRDLVEDVKWVCNAIIRNEFKRKQAPVTLKISNKNFKYGWTMPIVHGYKI